MARACVVVWTWLVLGLSGVCCDTVPTISCPRYVLEHTALTCSCSLPQPATGTVTWPGHSTNGTLTVPKVQRSHNGTVYRCEGEGGTGETQSVNYTLLVAYGPSEEKLTITGQRPFVTNGSQTLTLRCHTGEVYPHPDFAWHQVDCAGTETGNSTCDVTPQPPKDDGKEVRCDVTRKYGTDLPRTVMTAKYQLQLKYPPISPPVIHLQAWNSSLLRKGDNLTCSIRGGKPGVDRVVFTCSSPDHEDGEDEGEGDEVSSTVTVASLSRSRSAMRCVCRGVWGVRPQLYTMTAVRHFPVQHPAVVTNFTIRTCSGCEGSVTGDTNSSVTLVCSTFGRPAPWESHFSKAADPGFNASRYRSFVTSSNWTTEFRLEVRQLTCEDTGRYICSTDNGLGPRASASVLLGVRCGPRRGWEGEVNMTEEGIRFQLTAFPVPQHFTFHHLGNHSLDHNGTVAGTDQFFASCTQDDVILYRVRCHVRPVHVTSEETGRYRLTVGNTVDQLDLFFFIHTPVIPGGIEGLSAGTIAGITIAFVVAVIIVIVIVIVTWRRRKADNEAACPSDVTPESPQGHVNCPNDVSRAARAAPTRPPTSPTSTPIKGSTMTESDLGYSSSSAGSKTPMTTQSAVDAGYEVVKIGPDRNHVTGDVAHCVHVHMPPDTATGSTLEAEEPGKRSSAGKETVTMQEENGPEDYAVLCRQQTAPPSEEPYSHIGHFQSTPMKPRQLCEVTVSWGQLSRW
ncbi:uncharacterized protein LOC143277684 [Babylonia areolata]|uniref:uncharacterized protein LOC143277684 n=1 Tax=Babylonia areolata TaxID=304850 RepID=UPI003FD24279